MGKLHNNAKGTKSLFNIHFLQEESKCQDFAVLYSKRQSLVFYLDLVGIDAIGEFLVCCCIFCYCRTYVYILEGIVAC